MLYLYLYIAVGFGVVLALTAAGFNKLKKFSWKNLIVGHILALFLWPIAIYNNRNTIK